MLDHANSDTHIRVIIADDNDLVRDVVRDLIEHGLSAECSTAPNLDIALDIASSTRFDLALLDYNMPGMDGLNGLRRMMQCDVRNFALLSGRISSEIIDEALDLGISGFIPKTLNPNVIVEAVRDISSGEKFPAYHFLNQLNRHLHYRSAAQDREG